MLNIKYDERKDLANLEKHGIDFIDVQAFWSDPDLPKFKLELMMSRDISASGLLNPGIGLPS